MTQADSQPHKVLLGGARDRSSRRGRLLQRTVWWYRLTAI